MRQFWAAPVSFIFSLFFMMKPSYQAMLDCALIDIFIPLHVFLVQYLQRVRLVVSDTLHQFWAVCVFYIVFPRERATIVGSARIPFFSFDSFLSRSLCIKQYQTARSSIFFLLHVFLVRQLQRVVLVVSTNRSDRFIFCVFLVSV